MGRRLTPERLFVKIILRVVGNPWERIEQNVVACSAKPPAEGSSTRRINRKLSKSLARVFACSVALAITACGGRPDMGSGVNPNVDHHIEPFGRPHGVIDIGLNIPPVLGANQKVAIMNGLQCHVTTEMAASARVENPIISSEVDVLQALESGKLHKTYLVAPNLDEGTKGVLAVYRLGDDAVCEEWYGGNQIVIDDFREQCRWVGLERQSEPGALQPGRLVKGEVYCRMNDSVGTIVSGSIILPPQPLPRPTPQGGYNPAQNRQPGSGGSSTTTEFPNGLPPTPLSDGGRIPCTFAGSTDYAGNTCSSICKTGLREPGPVMVGDERTCGPIRKIPHDLDERFSFPVINLDGDQIGRGPTRVDVVANYGRIGPQPLGTGYSLWVEGYLFDPRSNRYTGEKLQFLILTRMSGPLYKSPDISLLHDDTMMIELVPGPGMNGKPGCLNLRGGQSGVGCVIKLQILGGDTQTCKSYYGNGEIRFQQCQVS